MNEFYVNRVHKIDYVRRRGAVLFIMMGVNILSGIFPRIVITVNKQMAKQESTGKHTKTDCCRMPIYCRRNPLLSVLAIANCPHSIKFWIKCMSWIPMNKGSNKLSAVDAARMMQNLKHLMKVACQPYSIQTSTWIYNIRQYKSNIADCSSYYSFF